MLSGQIPNMCKIACYDIEDLGGESNRQQVNKRFKEFTKLLHKATELTTSSLMKKRMALL